MQESLALQQHEAIAASRRFRQRYPRSRYIPNALYIEGQAADTRIAPQFGIYRGDVLLRYYQEFPSPASESAWRELYEQHPESPLRRWRASSSRGWMDVWVARSKPLGASAS